MKRFRTRRYWHGTTAWMVVGSVLFLCAFVIMEYKGATRLLPLATGMFVAGLLIAFFRDRGDVVYYEIDRDRVVLHRGRHTPLEIPVGHLRDASVVDRNTAVEYVRRKRLESKGPDGMADTPVERHTHIARFCTMDLGLHDLLFGSSGRLFVPVSRPKDDLVLLRLRDGREFVLSPVHYQDMVSTIARSLTPPAQQQKRA